MIVWRFSMVLGFSRLIWARFAMHQDLPTVLRCHVAASDALGGARENCFTTAIKTAVVRDGEHDAIVYSRALPAATLSDQYLVSVASGFLRF